MTFNWNTKTTEAFCQLLTCGRIDQKRPQANIPASRHKQTYSAETFLLCLTYGNASITLVFCNILRPSNHIRKGECSSIITNFFFLVSQRTESLNFPAIVSHEQSCEKKNVPAKSTLWQKSLRQNCKSRQSRARHLASRITDHKITLIFFLSHFLTTVLDDFLEMICHEVAQCPLVRRTQSMWKHHGCVHNFAVNQLQRSSRVYF